MNLYSLGAADKSFFPELLHERIDSRTCGAHHFRQDFVREVRNLNARPAVLTQVRKPQKHVGQPLFRGGGQQVCDMIPIVLDVGKKMRQQGARSFTLSANHFQHLVFLDDANGAGRQRDSRAHTQGIVCEAKLAKKITYTQDCGNSRWPLASSGREAHPSFLNIEKRIGGFTLRVDVLLLPVARNLASQV